VLPILVNSPDLQGFNQTVELNPLEEIVNTKLLDSYHSMVMVCGTNTILTVESISKVLLALCNYTDVTEFPSLSAYTIRELIKPVHF
jgi:hypothetical protein